MRFIDNAWQELHRLWTVRLALFMFVLTGGVLALPALQDKLNPYFFIGLSMAAWGLVGFLRLVKQVPPANIKGGE